MPSWDPALHPRGMGGRFALVGGGSRPSGRGLPSNLRELQGSYLDSDPDQIASGRGRGDEIQRAYFSGKLWSGKPLSKAPPATQRALREWQLSPDINEEVRGQYGSQALSEDVSRIDAAIEQNQLSQDTVVYRGLDLSLVEGGEGERLAEGDQFIDDGFTPTSLDPSEARKFGDDILEITLPEGTHVAPISRLGADEWGHQAELLVGRGGVYEIDEIIESSGSGTFDPSRKERIIRARLVGYAEPPDLSSAPAPTKKYPRGLADMQVVALRGMDGDPDAAGYWDKPADERKRLMKKWRAM